MADTLIANLTAIDALADGDEFPVNDVSAVDDRKVTGLKVANYMATKGPTLLFVKSVTNLTAGAPADIATITIPAGIARYRVTGTTAAQSFHALVTETQVATPAAGTMAVFDQAAGAGNQVMATTAPSAGAGTIANWGATSAAAMLSASTLTIRQMANSINSATISFYILIEPLP